MCYDDDAEGSVEFTAFLRVNEYITRSPARNPRIVDTMKVIVTPRTYKRREGMQLYYQYT